MSQTVQAIQLRVGNELLMQRESDGQTILAKVVWVSGEVIYTGETMIQVEFPDGFKRVRASMPIPAHQLVTLVEAFVTGENR